MSLDRESVLRPLRAAHADLAALRAGGGDEHERSRAVVRVAGAAEMALRRFLRDDPTVPVELRLRALSPDDLPQDELLAELRRRNRLPVELAAAFHHLFGAASHIARGAGAAPQDAELALSVADGLERHLHSLPPDVPLGDPVTEPEEPLAPEPEEEQPVRAGALPVPPATWGRSLRILGVAGGALALVLLAVLAWRATRGEDRLAQGEALLRQGRTAAAAEAFRDHAAEHEDDALSRVYLARIFREGGRYEDAAAQLRAALRADSADHRVRTEWGYLLLSTARPGDAARMFRDAVRQEPESALAWAGLVRALRAMGQTAAAERALLDAPPEVRALLSRDVVAPLPQPQPAAPPAGTVPPAPGYGYDTMAAPL